MEIYFKISINDNETEDIYHSFEEALTEASIKRVDLGNGPKINIIEYPDNMYSPALQHDTEI